MKKIFNFVKSEIVLVISFVLAIASCFIVTPNKGYIDYIDFRTLVLLFSLMAVAAGIVSSQVFSNVPAAILLSNFTEDAKALLIGVNLGGLGTLIASMASLISFKLIQKEKIDSKKYILVFTLINIAFLFINLLLTLM